MLDLRLELDRKTSIQRTDCVAYTRRNGSIEPPLPIR